MKFLEMGPFTAICVGLVTTEKDWQVQSQFYWIDGGWKDHPRTLVYKGEVQNCPKPLIVVQFPWALRGDKHLARGYCVHEAVHVWQFMRPYLDMRGMEVEAYTIQWIAGWLMKEMRV